MKKVKTFKLSLMMCLTLLFVSTFSSNVSVYAATDLTVDLSSVIGPVTHAAAGSLYGVDVSHPDNGFILPLRAKSYANPAMSGPDNHRLEGDGVPVAQRLANTGSKVTLRLADMNPNWYDFPGLTSWYNKITSLINEVQTLGLTNIYGYEVWNEPENNSWHGKFVGNLDNSNSYVDFFVNVPTTKSYTMTIGYANGSGANSTHNLCYNGLPCTSVTYPPTEGWGIFNTVSANVNLTAGNNIIRLAKGTGSAELDYIDIPGAAQTRYEAENGTINQGVIKNNGFSSSNDTDNLTFNEMFSLTYTKIKQLDPSAKVIGPSYASFFQTGMRNFLSYQKAHNTLPDIVSWHQLLGQNFTNDYNTYRALETSLGISPRLISINEYSGGAWFSDEGKPGVTAPLIAKFERLKIDTAMQSLWNGTGTLGSLLTNTNQRNGGWWFYKWYGDMSGNMVSVTPPNVNSMTALDGFANVDSDRKYASVLFGGVTDGTVNAVIKNFPSFFGGNGSKVHVRVESTPWVNRDTAVNTTTTILEGDYTIASNQINVSISGLNNSYGYRIYITPFGQATNVYEAEHAAVNHAIISNSSNASGGKYVSNLDYSDSYVDFYVKVATTKTYTMTIRYANGTGANSTHNLCYNGGACSTVTYPATAGWGQFSTVNVSVNLTAGDNIIRLAKGTTYAELDSITIN